MIDREMLNVISTIAVFATAIVVCIALIIDVWINRD
jgi:hypothetical protein